MDVCLRVRKESKKMGSIATVSGTVYWSYPILPFGIVACTFFLTTFLEVAVCVLHHRLPVSLAPFSVHINARIHEILNNNSFKNNYQCIVSQKLNH